ncbi:MAG: DNA repair protein RecO [Lachnospiraceae bacterium]|jgi:DNA repair protein RecO (recombination protein O)|nr:DNA repair protein RecO [Lachnospiraceae bacterium]
MSAERLKLTGMVLLAAPVGDYDKRLVILTKERGRISAFARGARRQNSPMIAAANPFCFAEFECYEGRDSYTVVKASVKNYFRELAEHPVLAGYGFYFLEIANYYTRENLDETPMLKLLYQSMRALLSGKISNRLIRRIFEMKAMVINGEYPVMEQGKGYDDSTIYALSFITTTPVERLYTFQVTEPVYYEMAGIIDAFMRKHIDRTFKSLEILQLMED